MARVIRALLQGGLGNQLFIYASALATSQRLGMPLVLDTSWLAVDPNGRKFELQLIIPRDVRVEQESWLPSSQCMQTSSVVRTLFSHALYRRTKLRGNLWREIAPFSYESSLNTVERDITLWGYFQHPRYVEPVGETIIKSINKAIFDPQTEHWLKHTHKWINNLSNPICVHVRRGDYEHEGTRQVHGLLSADYYFTGIERLESKVHKSDVVVISDSPLTAKRLFNFRPDAFFLKEPPGVAPLATLVAAKNFQRFVLANSSFSWWWAWLSGSKEVVAPASWMSNDETLSKRLCPKDWVLI